MSAGSSPPAPSRRPGGRGPAGAIGGFLRRTPAERLAIVRAVPVLLRIEAGLRRHPVPRLAARLGVRMGTEPDRPPVLGRVELDAGERRAAIAARRLVRRWPASARCLRRSLLIGYALRHRKPVLRIGVAKHDGRVHAHAWIEIDGRVPQDLERDVDFTPLRRPR